VAEFDLETIVRAAIEQAESPDVPALAARLEQDIPQDRMAEALRETLPCYVRAQLSLYRTAMLRRHRAAAKERQRSPKWERVAEATRSRWWHVSVPVRGGRTVSKWLGDCTVEEVRAVAAAYGQRASQQAAYEKRYSRLAEEMERRSAKLVKELPEAVIEEMFA